jgi:hypothetical protein
MEVYEHDYDGQPAWGIQGDGINQPLSPDDTVMSREQAEQLMEEIVQRRSQ